MKDKIGLLILLLACFTTQCTVMDFVSIGSIRPNLLIILCVSTGLIRGRKTGLWAGFFSGLLTDLFFGSLFGFYALVYMYVGYFCGYAHQYFYDDDLRVPVVMTAFADLIFNIAVYGLAFLLRGRLGFSRYFLRIILPEVFYTSLVSFLVYRLFRFILYRLKTIAWKESESIWVLK